METPILRPLRSHCSGISFSCTNREDSEPGSCINGFVHMPTRAMPVEFPSFDVGGYAGSGRSGAVGGVKHGVAGMRVIVDGA